MAFSSKPPASSKDVFMPPMSVSSGSLSASLYPPGSQKESSAASSQSTKGKKRNRGDGHDSLGSSSSLFLYPGWAPDSYSWERRRRRRSHSSRLARSSRRSLFQD
ncbi:hypothetical protein LWI29_035238 [Acer saccharum]|uniref:Uncharacterized protein n=1 Tax=Acer saccharum TaxID=4024 RepID=A0AA39TU24_ACESA|nr:hypothetical protein LWI29_035238 [Acer saccharum]